MMGKPAKVHLEVFTEGIQHKAGIEIQEKVRASMGMQ